MTLDIGLLLRVVVDVKLDPLLVMSRRALVGVDVRPLFHILWTMPETERTLEREYILTLFLTWYQLYTWGNYVFIVANYTKALSPCLPVFCL